MTAWRRFLSIVYVKTHMDTHMMSLEHKKGYFLEEFLFFSPYNMFIMSNSEVTVTTSLVKK